MRGLADRGNLMNSGSRARGFLLKGEGNSWFHYLFVLHCRAFVGVLVCVPGLSRD